MAHLVALPPLDLFADVRILLTHASSYPVFVGGLALSLALRAALLAFLIGGPRTPAPSARPIPYLPATPEFHAVANLFLDGQPHPACPLWRIAPGPIGRPWGAFPQPPAEPDSNDRVGIVPTGADSRR